MKKILVILVLGLLLSACQPVDFNEKPPGLRNKEEGWWL